MALLTEHIVNHPSQLKELTLVELSELANEIRTLIISVMANNAGHFGSSMGAVELSIALHKVFNTPQDQIVWDVGHQSYAHKILSGRRDEFPRIRQKDGISGFPKIEESEFDAFGTGHSSTSISAALGLAEANSLKGKNTLHIAVIGDGALTGGLAFEGLNNAALSESNLLIIVNDNGMSIDPNVGAIDTHLKTILPENNLFTNLGFEYSGPIDGNDLGLLIDELSKEKYRRGVHVLHVKTKKGNGFLPAEKGNATTWHAPGKFDSKTGGRQNNSAILPPKYQDVFGETLIELASENENVIGITPAMAAGSGMSKFAHVFPDRFFDVGIAEQHAITFSAGLAKNGMIPFCSIYSTFLQRGYDQLIHDVALQNLHVIFCVDRAGIAGSDGATHQGVFDLAFLRAIPNLTVLAPMNELQLRDMMKAALTMKGPVVIRYPRGRGVYLDWNQPFKIMEAGKGRLLSKSGNLAILSLGHPGNSVQEVLLQGHQFSHYDMCSLKPIDHEMLLDAFHNHDTIITVEDGTLIGGLASAILEWKNANGFSQKVYSLGIPDRFIEHGEQEELQKECGFDAKRIEQFILSLSDPEA
ncbi:MAG: 1-deoxy-D-xylulose-5-phosphate synthase [Crocinitomicaceae bacterium]|nr:1-deoxy-D-xylulose-5-phosphate synthase [Crocinitomicaceae bacterium]MBT6028988.1 1-deoxy-D-xylulose-5-phosphate synthase [Crocinitomicaceae bacterium]MBT6514636.1 1-deoxy-D-xylulose-5-phosphate synthase [Crocinitomicaceae bacterium]